MRRPSRPAAKSPGCAANSSSSWILAGLVGRVVAEVDPTSVVETRYQYRALAAYRPGGFGAKTARHHPIQPQAVRDTYQRLLGYLIEHALVIALGAVELARALTDQRQVHRQALGRGAFAQLGDADDDRQLLAAGSTADELHADALVGGADGAGALGVLVAPVELGVEPAGQAGTEITTAIRQAFGCRIATGCGIGLGLSMDLAGRCQRHCA